MDNIKFQIPNSKMNPEVITMGRVSADLYPEQIGVTLAEVETFAKSLGGSATNVAVAAARLGHPSALITKAGDDGFGQYVRTALEGFGVDTTWVSADPALWASKEDAAHCYRQALRHATVAVGNQSEVEVAVGTGDPFEASEALLDLGIELAIVKRGPRGVLARTKEGVAEAPPIEVEIVNGLGAGDAFGGALCHALLSGWDAKRTIRYANAAGAIVASRLACADDMPTREEVEQLLEKSSNA